MRGLAEFSDWAKAAGLQALASTPTGGRQPSSRHSESGQQVLRSAVAFTVPILGGSEAIGFVTMHFGRTLFGAMAPKHSGGEGLKALCAAVGEAIFVRRAFAIQREAHSPMRVGGTTPKALHAKPTPPLLRSSSMKLAAGAEAEALELEELDAEAPARLAVLQDWDLDAWALSDEDIKETIVHMFHHLGLLRAFRIRVQAMRAFVDEAGSHYYDNPFHCYRHAFTVVHTAWRFIHLGSSLSDRMSDLDRLALLLSAVCHDLVRCPLSFSPSPPPPPPAAGVCCTKP